MSDLIMRINDYKTPIQKLNLKINNNDIYIKRDDLFPVSFGGNKARKAVLFFEDLKQKNKDCIVTYGSSSSNHCRVIANMAASYGIPCHIISPTQNIKETANSKLIDIFGASITFCDVKEVRDTIDGKIEQLKSEGYDPYFIQGGGHGNIGTQAYVNVYNEIKKSEKENNIDFDYIFHTSGTGTTQAGLICGKLMNGDENRKIIGISNARKNPYGSQVVLDSVNNYLESINMMPVSSKEVTFIDDFVLDGYASFHEDILITILEVLKNEGIPLDTTYTGKAFWGMKEYIKENNIQEKNILFIHTGGTPLFFDALEDLKNVK